jgi:CheY-like chemotaxis protein
VFLPRATEVARESPVAVEHASTGSDLVLLVEDEEGVRRVSRRALELHGYQVLEAAHGDDALALAAAHPIRLMISDVMMPGMLGPALAEQVHRLLPGLPVLFMSGHTDQVVREGLLDPTVPFLPKPFTPSQLVASARQLLDGPARR